MELFESVEMGERDEVGIARLLYEIVFNKSFVKETTIGC